MNFNILISGAGSIGTRHAENLRSIGVKQVTLCDPHQEIATYDDLT